MTYGFLFLFAFVQTISYHNWFAYVEQYHLQLFTIIAYHLSAHISYDIYDMSYVNTYDISKCELWAFSSLTSPSDHYEINQAHQGDIWQQNLPANCISCHHRVTKKKNKHIKTEAGLPSSTCYWHAPGPLDSKNTVGDLMESKMSLESYIVKKAIGESMKKLSIGIF